jgi:CRISPR-associated endonuclease/helicase Cas3/CRISPR-associated endonuclease Cas3-HD
MIQSRPGESLISHCCLVAERSGEPCGWVHDVGKATEWFQRCVDPSIEESVIDISMRTHSRVGAYTAYYCARCRGEPPKHAFGDAIAIAKHHGHVPNAVAYVRDEFPGAKPWIDTARTALNRRPVEGLGSAPEDHNVKALAQLRHIDADADRREVANTLIEAASDDVGSWSAFVDKFEKGGLQREMREAVMKHALTASIDPDAFVGGDGRWYENMVQVYSSIQFADGTAAGGVADEAMEAPEFPADAMSDKVEKEAADATSAGVKGALNAIRDGVQQHVVDRLRDGLAERLDGGGAVRLTLDTGYGKTLASGLFVEELLAYRSRNLVKHEDESANARVVYALPFTTIADQTAGVFEEAFSAAGVDPEDTPLALSIDHHRAETPTDRLAEDREVSPRAAETILSSWRSRMTVTTTVQLFESIVGPWRSQSTKLPALENAIIVVDEPQAIPIAWRPLIRRTIETLVEEYGATVLLMTATQPFLVGGGENEDEDGTDAVDLITDDKTNTIERDAMDAAGIDDVPSRTRYHFDESALPNDEEGIEPISHREAGNRIGEAFTNDTEPVLAICNSVSSTRALTDAVESCLASESLRTLPVGPLYDDLLDPDDDRPSIEAVSPEVLTEHIESEIEPGQVPTFHFSRRMRGAKLLTMIEATKRLAERDEPLSHIVVSTQLVEAGVDISYRRVFRDFAPLDSIVQAAGRCNRSFEWGIDGGDVEIWTLESPGKGSRPPSEAAYNRARSDVSSTISVNTLRRSRNAISELCKAAEIAMDGEGFAEADLSAAVESYHRDLACVLSEISEADDVLLRAHSRGDGRTLREISLIEDLFEVDVVICATKGDWTLVNNYRTAVEEGNWGTAIRHRRQLTQLSVAVTVYSFDSDRWCVLSGLKQLVPDADGDERVVGRSASIVDGRDGIRFG